MTGHTTHSSSIDAPGYANYTSDGWSATGYDINPAWQCILAAVVLIVFDVVLIWYGCAKVRATKLPRKMSSPMRSGAARFTASSRRLSTKGSVDLGSFDNHLDGDVPVPPDPEAMEMTGIPEAPSTKQQKGYSMHRKSAAEIDVPVLLSEGPQTIVAFIPVLSGMIMLFEPTVAFFVSFPVILVTLLWTVRGRNSSAPGGAEAAQSMLALVMSFVTIPRLTIARSLPPLTLRKKRWTFPWLTTLIIALLQLVYFVDAFGQSLFDTDAILWKAATADASTANAQWWWGFFATAYNFEFPLHLLLVSACLMLVLYGVPAEAAWGALRTYVVPLLSVLIFPFLFYPNSGSICGRWFSGSSILLTALPGSVLTHSSINAHRWSAEELPHLFALHLWAWIYMVPVSYAPGGVCIKGHGASFMLGGLFAMITAPLFSEGGPIKCLKGGFNGENLDVWRWGWSAVGMVGMGATVAVAFIVDSDDAGGGGHAAGHH